MTDDQKALVENYDELTDAEKSFKELDDNHEFNEVMDLIDEIGEIKYPDSKEAIEAARDAYDKLSEEWKTLVKNYDELTNAEDTYNAVKEVVDLINVIGEVKYPDSKEAIEAARSAYDELTDVQKELVGFDNYENSCSWRWFSRTKGYI